MDQKKHFKREDLEWLYRSGEGVFNHNVDDSWRCRDGELYFGSFDSLSIMDAH